MIKNTILMFLLIAFCGCNGTTRSIQKEKTNSSEASRGIGVVTAVRPGPCLVVLKSNFLPASAFDIHSNRSSEIARVELIERWTSGDTAHSCSAFVTESSNAIPKGIYEFWSFKDVNKNLSEEGGVMYEVDGTASQTELFDTNNNGTKDELFHCTSHEGVHHIVYESSASGPLVLHHFYEYLGYDVTPDCPEWATK